MAEWIEYDKNKSSRLVDAVDEEEKARHNVSTPGGVQQSWFLTEDGLYEVLMQSRKPIAKAFKKEVKKILKQIRMTGGYIPTTNEYDEESIMAKAFMTAQNILEGKNKIKI